MIPSCKNCLYCKIGKGLTITPKNAIWIGPECQTYLCKKDMLFKKYDTLCSQWQHKNWLIRKLWRYFND